LYASDAVTDLGKRAHAVRVLNLPLPFVKRPRRRAVRPFCF
jgi:hypothetical protein